MRAGPFGANWWQPRQNSEARNAGGARYPMMGQGLARHPALERSVATGRPEALMLAHVARRARNALVGQGRVVIGVLLEGRPGADARPGADEWPLLRERRMTRVASGGRCGIGRPHLHELARDSGATGGGMSAVTPVTVLKGMAGAARLRIERPFERGETRGRPPLRGQGLPPVPGREIRARIASRHRRRQRREHHGAGHHEDPQVHAHHLTRGLTPRHRSTPLPPFTDSPC